MKKHQRWVLLSDINETRNREERNKSFVKYLYNTHSITCKIEKISSIRDLVRVSKRKYDVCIFQNRPRRNIFFIKLIKGKKKILDLRDPIIYKNNSNFDKLINIIILMYVKFLCKKGYINIFSRKNVGFSLFERNVLDQNITFLPEYGFRRKIFLNSTYNRISNLEIKKLYEKKIRFIVYAGNAYSKYYTECLYKLADSMINTQWYLVVAGNIKAKHEKIINLNIIPQDEVYFLYKICSGVVSINEIKEYNYMPSKTIEILAIGKYIIHFSENEDRICRLLSKWSIGYHAKLNDCADLSSIFQSDQLPKISQRLAQLVSCLLTEDNYFNEFYKKVDSIQPK